MTLACATWTEERAARRLGARTALVGVGARRPLPEGPVVSFGLAGGLHDGLECGEVLDATRVVDADGGVLWEGRPLGASGARTATILASDVIVDDPDERRRLHERTGADAIDMESGALARTGRLAGCLRAVSDTPSRPLGPLTEVLDANGKLSPGGIARALAAPRRTGRALADVRRALTALQHSAARSNGALA
jgi:adenosylhomocysteine nucleosidase